MSLWFEKHIQGPGEVIESSAVIWGQGRQGPGFTLKSKPPRNPCPEHLGTRRPFQQGDCHPARTHGACSGHTAAPRPPEMKAVQQPRSRKQTSFLKETGNVRPKLQMESPEGWGHALEEQPGVSMVGGLLFLDWVGTLRVTVALP